MDILQTATSATLKLTNQKNGRMGDTIHQEATGTDECPIKALALRIHHILSNGGTGENYLCDYLDGSTLKQVTSKNITDAVRKGATTLKLETKGIDSDLIGSHSL